MASRCCNVGIRLAVDGASSWRDGMGADRAELGDKVLA